MIVGAVVIGRNEGARLERCLAGLKGGADVIVYVDSGSADGSVAMARAAGVLVVELDPDILFTAARARNAGAEKLFEAAPEVSYIQFVDGDCEVRSDWIDTALAFCTSHPDVGVVCGRRRERHPEATLWNRLIDSEWEAPEGETRSCGGDALMLAGAFRAVGGYSDHLIAGEEPELCVRLRAAGWKVWRLAAEMTLHDADMTRFSQWWQRTRRAGHAFAEGAAMHGQGPDRHNVAAVRRIQLWGLALPVAALAGALVHPGALLLLLAYPIQILRLALRERDLPTATFLVLAKFPEAHGFLDYWTDRLRGRNRAIIEYK